MQSPTSPRDMAGLEQLARQRWSCRAFLQQPVPRPLIEQILATAQTSASWCNTQPWQLELLSGTETDRFRSALLAHAADGGARALDIPEPEYRGVYQQRRQKAGWQLYEAVGIRRGDREASARQSRQNLHLFGAPHVLIVSTDAALGPYGLMACGAWVQMFMLAATAAGIASIAQAAIARYSGFVRSWFSLADDRQVVCAISFGYADTRHPANGFRTDRAALDEVVTWRG